MGMISVDEAIAAIRGTLERLPAEEVPLERAPRRVLAEPVVARMSQPPFNASAMDGYAVHFEDVHHVGAALDVVGVSSAGEGFHRPLLRGAAVRIFTGAPLPDGADHVLIQEQAEAARDKVVVKTPQSRSQNVRNLGVDFAEGAELAAKGALLEGPALALIAAGNVPSVRVTRRPRVALIANGDELVPPGGRLRHDQIICSIPYGLSPMIEAWGGEAAFIGIARDDKESIRRLAEEARDFDLIVPIGGASVGDRDYMRPVFAELGFEPIFEKVSVKPGKPTWFSVKGRTAVIGLPGNPASALVTARLFLKSAIERLSGLSVSGGDVFGARTSIAIKENGARETYLRARVAESADGARIVTPFDNQDSSLLSVMARSNALIRRQGGAPATAAEHLVTCLAL
ncbi:MAG: molybdopterin molybdotransferase MoeA [Parvularculaceae bacterium]